MNPISQIIAGSLLLSIIHASVPNHWLPQPAHLKDGSDHFARGRNVFFAVSGN
jgi:hypothetical protein